MSSAWKVVQMLDAWSFDSRIQEIGADRVIKEAAAEIEKLRAALQSSRSDALEEAAQTAAHHERMAYQRGDLPLGDPNECAAQVAREIEAAIRALGDSE